MALLPGMEASEDMEEVLVVPPLDKEEDLLGRIAECVTMHDDRTLQAYILEQRLAQPTQFWELTTLLGPCLTTQTQRDHPRFFTTARRCLAHFAHRGNAKEMLLALLEQVEGFHDDVLYVAILPCLQDVLQRLPVKRGRSLELAMDTLGDHIAGIPPPENWMLEGEEMKLLEMDETIRRYLDVVPAFLDFMWPFLLSGGGVENPTPREQEQPHPPAVGNGDKTSKSTTDSNRQWEVRILKKHLMLLLKHPLVFLDLRHDKKTAKAKTYSREIAERVIEGLEYVVRNFCQPLLDARESRKNDSQTKKEKMAAGGGDDGSESKSSENRQSKMDETEEMVAENEENERRAAGQIKETGEEEPTEEEVSDLSAACLAYLVQVEGLGQSRWPCVYTHTHLLHTMLPFIRVLLTHMAYTAVYKGLSLLDIRLSLITDSSLPASSLDDPDLTACVLDLIHAMTHCPIRELRQRGLQVFRQMFSKLDSAGRHQLMRSVLTYCEHSGVRSVVIGMIKDKVDAALRLKDEAFSASEHRSASESGSVAPFAASELAGKGTTDSDKSNSGSSFFGPKLEQLLRLATKLSDGAATDLLDESDVIMATLNLLRYLILRDPKEVNHTGIWDMLGWIESEYISALRTGLDMSVGHYKLELDNMNKNTRKQQRSTDVCATLSVAGRELPPMTHEQRMTVMHSALVTFDIMKCVLGRLCELIDMKQKGN